MLGFGNKKPTPGVYSSYVIMHDGFFKNVFLKINQAFKSIYSADRRTEFSIKRYLFDVESALKHARVFEKP